MVSAMRSAPCSAYHGGNQGVGTSSRQLALVGAHATADRAFGIALVLVECRAATSHPIGRTQVGDGKSHEVLGLRGIAAAFGLYLRDLATKLHIILTEPHCRTMNAPWPSP